MAFLQHMRRLLNRPGKGLQTGKAGRHTLLKVLLVITAAVVLAFITWASLDTARITAPAPLRIQSNTTDYGHLAAMLLADDTFPSDTLSSQLWSYVWPNRKLRGHGWNRFDATINPTCPIKYKRLR